VHGGLEHRLLERSGNDSARLVVRERRQRDRERVRLPAAPAWPLLEQLGTRGAENEQGRIANAIGKLVDEVEQTVVCPVQVLEDEHERP
jgi:hypothetical protein